MVTYSVISSKGNREYNEDSILALQDNDRYCFVLADGLGGQGFGKVASETVVQAVDELFHKEMQEDFVANAFRFSQEQLCAKKSSKEYGDMMTTMVMVDIGHQIQWGHVGDSRLYHFKDGELSSQTLDHSVPQILVIANEIEPDEIRHHPDRNRLLKAMGKDWDRGDEFVLSTPVDRERRQAFLLCSDGFWEYIEEADMEQCLKEADSVECWLKKMIEQVMLNGKKYDMDNYSAIAIWID